MPSEPSSPLTAPAGLGAALQAAAERRGEMLADGQTEALRLLHHRGEGVEGLSVDRYGPLLLASAYDDVWCQQEGQEALREAFPETPLFLRRRGGGAGAAQQIGGPAHSGKVWVREGALRFEVDLSRGANPGLFLDTRPLRQWLQRQSAGLRMLNLFAYTCSLGIAAAAGGAQRTTNVDIAPAVLARGREAYRANELEGRVAEFLRGDARKRLSWLRARGRSYDIIVVDPPSFANRRSGGFDASTQYAATARKCLAIAAPGGRLVFTRNASTRDAEALETELAAGLPGCVLEEHLQAGPDFVPERAAGLTVLIFRVPEDPGTRA